MRSERTLLVGCRLPRQPSFEAEDSLQELELLAITAGAQVEGRSLNKLSRVNPAYYLGRGKLQELKQEVDDREVELLIFDEDLSPTQNRNLERSLGIKVVDRTGLILDIFARRARTGEGKLQVELAQLNYMLPRLSGKGIWLSRLGGGIGTRGPGETKLEMDRRRVQEKIARLRKRLRRVRRTRDLHRKGREGLPLVSIIGYTNSGKTSLFNRLTGEGALAEDKLFATLDPLVRGISLTGGTRVLVSDTVGLIKKLPHQLVAAFKATFEEITQADLLINVVDISHPFAREQMEVVDMVLEDMGLKEKPVIHALNKVDRLGLESIPSWHRQLKDRVLLSALTGEGIEELKAKLEFYLKGGRVAYPREEEVQADPTSSEDIQLIS